MIFKFDMNSLCPLYKLPKPLLEGDPLLFFFEVLSCTRQAHNLKIAGSNLAQRWCRFDLLQTKVKRKWPETSHEETQLTVHHGFSSGIFFYGSWACYLLLPLKFSLSLYLCFLTWRFDDMSGGGRASSSSKASRRYPVCSCEWRSRPLEYRTFPTSAIFLVMLKRLRFLLLSDLQDDSCGKWWRRGCRRHGPRCSLQYWKQAQGIEKHPNLIHRECGSCSHLYSDTISSTVPNSLQRLKCTFFNRFGSVMEDLIAESWSSTSSLLACSMHTTCILGLCQTRMTLHEKWWIEPKPSQGKGVWSR